MGVAVYIPAYNAARYIAASIESVLGQSYPVDRVIVVDDASTDDTADIARRYPVEILRNGRNEGLAFCRNRAVVSCGEEFIGSIDADCVADADWLKECMRHFSDHSVAAVGGCLLEPGLDLAGCWRKVHLAQNPGQQCLRKVSFLAGCNTVYRRKTLLDCGLYDVKYRRYHEDSSLGKRISSGNNGVLLYDPQAVVKHMKKDSVGSLMETCWNFRHPEHIGGPRELIVDILLQLRHAASITARDLFFCRLKLLAFDVVYFPWQVYFSARSLTEK